MHMYQAALQPEANIVRLILETVKKSPTKYKHLEMQLLSGRG